MISKNCRASVRISKFHVSALEGNMLSAKSMYCCWDELVVVYLMNERLVVLCCGVV